MRIYLVTAAAAAAFIVSLTVSQVADVAVRAASVFSAIVFGNLAAGFAAAALIGSWQQRQRGLGSCDSLYGISGRQDEDDCD